MTTLERQWSEYRAYAQRRGIRLTKGPYIMDNPMSHHYTYTVIYFEKRVNKTVYHTYRSFNDVFLRAFFRHTIMDGINELEAFIEREQSK